MSPRMKIIIGAAALLFVLLISILFVIGIQYGDTYNVKQQPSFISAIKHAIKGFLHVIKNGIYHFATIFNPPGDTIPDWVDDAILGKIKAIF